MISDKKFSDILNMSNQQFEQLIADENPTLGETLSLKSLIAVCYNQVRAHKDALIQKYLDPKTSDDKEKIPPLVEEMLKLMLSLEFKVLVLSERVKKLTKDV